MSSNRSNPPRGPRTKYSAEVKAAVMAALLAGGDPTVLATEYRLPIGTVKGWKSKQANGEVPVSVTTPEQRTKIGQLLVGYLEDVLKCLRHQVNTVFSDEAWLRKQDAAELAELHGMIADRGTKFLEAMERPDDPVPSSDGATA